MLYKQVHSSRDDVKLEATFVPMDYVVKREGRLSRKEPTDDPQIVMVINAMKDKSRGLAFSSSWTFPPLSSFFSSLSNEQKQNCVQKNAQWFQCQMLPLYLKLQILCSSFIIKTTTTRVKCQNSFRFMWPCLSCLPRESFRTPTHPSRGQLLIAKTPC